MSSRSYHDRAKSTRDYERRSSRDSHHRHSREPHRRGNGERSHKRSERDDHSSSTARRSHDKRKEAGEKEPKRHEKRSKREKDEEKDYQRQIEEELKQQAEEQAEQELIRKRRERRKQIEAKYKQEEQEVEQQEQEKIKRETNWTNDTTIENKADKSEEATKIMPPPEEENQSTSAGSGDTATICLNLPEMGGGDDHDDDDMFDMFNEQQVAEEVEGVSALEFSELQIDEEGYYIARLGEVLGRRYRITATIGKGVFSTVAKAKHLKTGEEVALKVLRNNDAIRRAGEKEVEILTILHTKTNPEKNCCIKFFESFEDRGHLCIVFEAMAYNLRELVRKFGKGVGLNITLVRLYAFKLFKALFYLKKCGILHADIKPDNILVNETKGTCKLADFGSASLVQENDITPYLVSRWYRAPEIILGLKYNYAIDMFSMGCTLYELYTGSILFRGKNNNQMLHSFHNLMGKFPRKLLKKGAFAMQHFDERFSFMHETDEGFTKKESVIEANIDLKQELLSCTPDSSPPSVTRKVLQLHDLLVQCLALDPKKRITPECALKHDFFRTDMED